MNPSVVRVGNTVRRQASPWTPTLHRLLSHVRSVGVTWVPRVHGFDAEGREVLDYIEGEVGHGDPDWIRTPEVLADVARAQREWHDATATFEVHEDDQWFFPGQPPFEVITHNDFAPYNHVFRDGRWVGAIDYDICYPSYRSWDMAWTAYRYVPLTPQRGVQLDDGPDADRNPFSSEEAERRLLAFLDHYNRAGLGVDITREALLQALEPRLHAGANWCMQQSDPSLLAHGTMYRAHARWLRGSRGTENSN